MAWKTTQRYSPIHSTASSRRHNWKVHLGILFYIMLLLSFCCAIPLLIHFFARPDNGEWYPPNVMCATCEEMDTHNPALLEYAHNGVEMACRGPTNYDDPRNLVNVTFRGIKRCWALEQGKDEWLRPIGWSREDMLKYIEGREAGRGES